MNRTEYVLAAMSAAERQAFSPVQVQKLFFLLDRNVSGIIGGPFFDSAPYDYGPFDKDVYHTLNLLRKKGYVEVRGHSWHRTRAYCLTEDGQKNGSAKLQEMPPNVKEYIREMVKWLLPLSFSEIVSFIYANYPEMREHSVFQD